jgi:predicted small lipoprotein YifL
MKIRFLSLLLALGMILSLVACGGQTPAEPSQEETTPVEDTTEEQAPPADSAPVTVDGLAVGTGLMEEVEPEMQLDDAALREVYSLEQSTEE